MRQITPRNDLTDAIRGGFAALDRIIGRPVGRPTPIYRKDCAARLEDCVLCDPSEGPLNVQLPRVGHGDIGRVLSVKNASMSPAQIAVKAALRGDTIDGQPILTMASGGDYRVLVCVGPGEWISNRQPGEAAPIPYVGGQGTATGKIALFTFAGGLWSAVSGIPDVSGNVVAIYARSSTDIWIVVDTTSGTDRVFSFDGSSWTERTAAIYNAFDLSGNPFAAYAVCGDDAGKDVFIGGSYDWSSGDLSGTNGFVVRFNGTSFGSVWESGSAYPVWAIDVVAGGLAFGRTPAQVISNRGGSWGIDGTVGTGGTPRHGIKAFANDSVITNLAYIGNHGWLWEYDGTWSDTYIDDGAGMALDGLSPNDFWCCAYGSTANRAGHIVGKVATVYDGAGIPWTAALRHLLVLGASDVWVCGDFEAGWGAPVLSHWDGSDWSDETSFGVGDIGSYKLACFAKAG